MVHTVKLNEDFSLEYEPYIRRGSGGFITDFYLFRPSIGKRVFIDSFYQIITPKFLGRIKDPCNWIYEAEGLLIDGEFITEDGEIINAA